MGVSSIVCEGRIKMKTLAYTQDSKKQFFQKLNTSGWQKVGETKYGKDIYERYGQRILVIDFHRDYGIVTAREKYGGFTKKFYLVERQLFPQAFETKVSDAGARIIVSKLLRHFFNRKLVRPNKWGTLREVHLRFRGNGGGSAGYNHIRLPHNPSLGILCHEVAHLKHLRHTKKMMIYIKRLLRYCEKHNYWKEEIERRTQK